MAAKPGNRLRVSSSPTNEETTTKILNSIPLRCWTGFRRTLRSSPPTCRPSENASPAIWIQLTAHNHPRNLAILHLNPLLLARHAPLSPPNRLWLCDLLHSAERSAAECRVLQLACFNWRRGQEWETESFLLFAETLEPREPHNGCGS
jgi:hypothetical protein